MSAKAPGDLELLRSFVNTTDPDTQTDELDTPLRMHDWLAARGLLGADSTVDEQAHRQTLELREALRALALANGATELDPTVIATLNELATGTSLSVLLNPDGHAELHPTGEGLKQTFGQLLAITYNAMVDGTFPRLKACANETCRWLYYDHSKNRSKKWCEMQTCGNVINARAYRQRHSHEASTEGPRDKP
ncbi:MAG: CGNR zinc finger domain-containing protein [Acidimicrobiia bacterium]|nr:CGNR zinc finger domain-containing protein [Acidimicrobiia bacterium]